MQGIKQAVALSILNSNFMHWQGYVYRYLSFMQRSMKFSRKNFLNAQSSEPLHFSLIAFHVRQSYCTQLRQQQLIKVLDPFHPKHNLCRQSYTNTPFKR
jgi:hypothetical protein